MSLSMILLKMLHCNQTNGRSMSARDDSACSISLDNNSREKISIKKEHNDESVCRACLKEGFIPIFGNKTELVESFNAIAGIEIKIDDPYPKHLCDPCYTLLQGAILFRETAQQSDQTLKHPPEDLPTADNNDMANSEDTAASDDILGHPEDKNTYYCNKCDIIFDSFKKYTDHRQTEEHKNKKLAYKKHLASHEETSSYMCDICGKKFKLEKNLTHHRHAHFYKTCSKGIYTKRELDLRYKVEHKEAKYYVCNICGKAFGYRKLMMRHQIKVHKRAKLKSSRMTL